MYNPFIKTILELQLQFFFAINTVWEFLVPEIKTDLGHDGPSVNCEGGGGVQQSSCPKDTRLILLPFIVF